MAIDRDQNIDIDLLRKLRGEKFARRPNLSFSRLNLRPFRRFYKTRSGVSSCRRYDIPRPYNDPYKFKSIIRLAFNPVTFVRMPIRCLRVQRTCLRCVLQFQNNQ